MKKFEWTDDENGKKLRHWLKQLTVADPGFFLPGGGGGGVVVQMPQIHVSPQKVAQRGRGGGGAYPTLKFLLPAKMTKLS